MNVDSKYDHLFIPGYFGDRARNGDIPPLPKPSCLPKVREGATMEIKTVFMAGQE